MIRELSDLTMRQYVDMLCGDASVLLERREVASPKEIESVRRKLVFDYARLSDSAGMRAMLSEMERKKKAHAELLLFQVLSNLIALRGFAEARGVLRTYGIAREMDDAQTAAEVERLLRRAETEKKRAEQERGEKPKEHSPAEIRAQFDRQAASLMSYFKFQIDFNAIPASQFACLVDQAQREIKAKMAACKRN